MCRYPGTVCFGQMQIGAPQYQAHGHKIDRVDLLKWAHGQHTGTVFLTNANWGRHTGKCKLGPPKMRNAATK